MALSTVSDTTLGDHSSSVSELVGGYMYDAGIGFDDKGIVQIDDIEKFINAIDELNKIDFATYFITNVSVNDRKRILEGLLTNNLFLESNDGGQNDLVVHETREVASKSLSPSNTLLDMLLKPVLTTLSTSTTSSQLQANLGRLKVFEEQYKKYYDIVTTTVGTQTTDEMHLQVLTEVQNHIITSGVLGNWKYVSHQWIQPITAETKETDNVIKITFVKKTSPTDKILTLTKKNFNILRALIVSKVSQFGKADPFSLEALPPYIVITNDKIASSQDVFTFTYDDVVQLNLDISVQNLQLFKEYEEKYDVFIVQKCQKKVTDGWMAHINDHIHTQAVAIHSSTLEKYEDKKFTAKLITTTILILGLLFLLSVLMYLIKYFSLIQNTSMVAILVVLFSGLEKMVFKSFSQLLEIFSSVSYILAATPRVSRFEKPIKFGSKGHAMAIWDKLNFKVLTRLIGTMEEPERVFLNDHLDYLESDRLITQVDQVRYEHVMAYFEADKTRLKTLTNAPSTGGYRQRGGRRTLKDLRKKKKTKRGRGRKRME